MTQSFFTLTPEDIQESNLPSSSISVESTSSPFKITPEDVGLPTTTVGVMPPSDYADSFENILDIAEDKFH
mgnify:FL=1